MIQIVLIEKGTGEHIAHFKMGKPPPEISIVSGNDLENFSPDRAEFYKIRVFHQAGYLAGKSEYYYLED